MLKTTALSRVQSDINHYESELRYLPQYHGERSFIEFLLGNALQEYDDIVNADDSLYQAESETIYKIYRTITIEWADSIETNTECIGVYKDLAFAAEMLNKDRKYMSKNTWFETNYFIEVATVWF